jgi:hypothetical protein
MAVQLLKKGTRPEKVVELAEIYQRNNRIIAYFRLPKEKELSKKDIEGLGFIASTITHIPAEILYGILKTETNGTNLGGCSAVSGGLRPRARMSAKQRIAFLEILDRMNTSGEEAISAWYPAVSCHYKRGRGGAMGLAQVLPATFLAYETRIRDTMGISTFASPYNPVAAILAAAMIVADMAKIYHDADARSVSLEDTDLIRNLGATYNAGGNWEKKHPQTYGERVLERALMVRGIQQQYI